MATAQVQSGPANVQNGCPRCGKALTDSTGLGWCSACGYCRSLEEAPRVEKTPETTASLLEPTPQGKPQEFLIPIWSLVLVLGMGLIGLMAYFAGKQLAEKPFERALWTSVQIGVGVIVLLLGQLLALIQIAPHDEKLSFKDLFLPLRLYGQVFTRLPRCQVSVWTLGWGLSLIASALLLIGGLGHWFTYIKGNKNQATVGGKR